MRYVQRHSPLARAVHWGHTLGTVALLATGLVLFVPAINALFGVEAIQAMRIVHRVAAVVFIGAPVLGAIVSPKGLKHFLGEMFAKWDADDREFMRKFIPYLFRPSKVHMPKQRELKSGQRVADLVLIAAAVAISISGVVLWAASSFSPEVVRAMYLVHDASMILFAVVLVAHIYLGAGVFQPYRGAWRMMFGNGQVSEADARYHWGHWADEKFGTAKREREHAA